MMHRRKRRRSKSFAGFSPKGIKSAGIVLAVGGLLWWLTRDANASPLFSPNAPPQRSAEEDATQGGTSQTY